MTLSSRGCKTEKGTYFPMLNYTVECNQENINEFKKPTGKLIEEKSIMEMQCSSQKVTNPETEFPFSTFLHYASTPGYNQSQETDLYGITFMLSTRK